MSMKIGTSALLPGYKHIFLLNGLSFTKDKNALYKYYPLSRFIKMVDDGELVFVSPEKWYDPFEQLYFKIDCSSRGYQTEDIACMCVSEFALTNEDACWKVYSDKKTVRVSFDKDRFLELLEKYAIDNKCDVYIGRTDYSLTRKEIQHLSSPGSPYYTNYFPRHMTREHYLSLLLLKRKAFSYENEVRIFLVKKHIQFNEKMLKINCNYFALPIVKRIVLSPYPPIRGGKEDVAYKVRKKMNEIESKEIKRVLSEKVNCSIIQSTLYEDRGRIKRVIP